MKKTTGKIALLMALLMLVTVLLTACGGGDSKPAEGNTSGGSSAPAASGYTGDKYAYEGKSLPSQKAELPEGYPLVPHDKFLEAYKKVVDEIKTDATYSDVATLFGQEGIKMPINDKYPDIVTYWWVSDKEYDVLRYYGVSITFKVDNSGAMHYYAYSSDSITPDDVR